MRIAKTTISLLAIAIILSMQVFAITPIDDREEFDWGYINKCYVKDYSNNSFVIATDRQLYVKQFQTGDSILYRNYFWDNTYVVYPMPLNTYFVYTNYVNGVYELVADVYWWNESSKQYIPRDGVNYDIGYEPIVYLFERSNIDIPLVDSQQNFIKIFFSKDSALNLLPIAQSQLEIANTTKFYLIGSVFLSSVTIGIMLVMIFSKVWVKL